MLKIKDGFKGERSLIIPKMIIDYMEQDPYCQLLYLTDIGYYPKARHHFRERNEPIPQYIFIYCSEGKGWYKYGNSRHEIGPNQYFVLPAGEPHSYGSDPKNPWSIYWFHFNGSVAARNAEGLQVPHTAEPSATSRISDRLSLFEEMLFTLKSGYNRENLHYAHSILHHFFGSIRYVDVFRRANSGNKEPSNDNICHVAVHYMKENLEKHLTLSQLAEFTGYTPNHFASLFRKSIGHAPLSYFNLLKMQAAANMLDNTEMKVNQIAAKLGYDDTGYFTRIFTKIMGSSPTTYRQLTRG